MDSDMPQANSKPHEMFAKGVFTCEIVSDIVIGFDRNMPIVEQYHRELASQYLEITYEQSKFPQIHQTKPSHSWRIISSILIEGPWPINRHYWSDKDFDSPDAAIMALDLSRDDFTLGHSRYFSGLFLKLRRIYREDWQGQVIKPLSDATILVLSLDCRRHLIVEN